VVKDEVSMESISETVSRAAEQLLGRASGPMHLRLLIQPLMATLLATRAGLKDAREGNPAFLWALLSNPGAERKELAKSGWKDISKAFLLALAMDTVYQLIALRTFYVVQTLLVATGVCLIPYLLLRGIVTRVARLFTRPTR